MPYTIKVICGDQEQEITFEDDGTLSMPGYDPEYEEAMAEFAGNDYQLSLCHSLYEGWDGIADKVMEWLVEETRKTYYDEYRDRYGYTTERKVRPFNDGDLACMLAEILSSLVESEDKNALTIAGIIAKLNLKLDECPDIQVEEGSERELDSSFGVYRTDTHTLKICDVEISRWERMTERRIGDIMHFESYAEDLSDQMESYPSSLVQKIMEILGIADPDPGEPGGFDTPKHDESGEGVFGVMYETLIWEAGKRPHERDVCDPEVVVYDKERTAYEAAELSESLQSDWGGDEYRITVVRRMSPSELEGQRIAAVQRELVRKQYRLLDKGFEEVPEPDPIYTQWTELEDEDDRPEDFKG